MICGIDQGMIGVDIEKIEEIRIDEVIKFFSEEERIYLSLLNGRQRLLRFYDLWTLKESYLKAVGKGISHALDRFNVKFNSGIPYVTSPSNSFQIQKYNLRQIHVDPEYCLAICAKNNQFPKSITLITLNEILEHFKPYNRIP
ncbi:4-phosphopantetheinyl transferase family protein [Priestia megaterium]|nr:4-phosphopantetheinyl transferase family protein [Priestia megaterium]